MKKLFLGSIALTTFSIAILIFQMSCKKDANAQTSGSTTGLQQLNFLVYKKTLSEGGAGGHFISEIWTANYDGSNQQKINIALPTGIVFADDMLPTLSPDGKKVFFTGATITGSQETGDDLYSANIDGSSVIKIIDSGSGSSVFPSINIGGAY